MLNYGILCTAAISARFIKGVRESKDGNVYGVASRTLEKAKEYAESQNIEHYYGSYEELIQDENIDVVYIPLMNKLHYPYAKLAIENNKHVVMEKPFVIHTEEAVELFNLAKERKVFLMEAQKAVFLPTTIKLKELIESKEVGDIKYIELKASFANRFDLTHWMFDYYQGGGTLYGSTTYTVEFLQYLFDDPEFESQAFFIPSGATADTLVCFQLKFNDILVNSTLSMNCILQNEAVFYGTEGYITIPNYWKSNHLVIHKNDTDTRLDFPYSSEFVYEVDHINECIEKGLLQSPIMHEKKTIDTAKIVDQLYSTYEIPQR